MATARHRLQQLWELVITSTGAAQQADRNIANPDSIEFKNMAPFDVEITFTTMSGTVFNNIPRITANGGLSTPQTPQKYNVTVNYTIKNLSNNSLQGPYGIEVGTGPMQISILSGQPNPGTISIPQGGQIQFDNQDGVSYNVSWSPTGIFTPNVNPIQPGMNPVETEAVGNQANLAQYSLQSNMGVGGRGTVKINS